MSKWKHQIDQELGTNQKFHDELEQKIIQRASQRESKRFMYPLTLVSISFVAILLFFIMPEQTSKENVAMSHSLLLNEFEEGDSVSAFYVSYLQTEPDYFLARSNPLAFGTERFSSKDDIQVLMPLLQSAKLTTRYDTYDQMSYDVLLTYNSGQEKKLNISRIGYDMVIHDVETNLTYVVDETYGNNLLKILSDRQPSFLLFLALGIVTFWLVLAGRVQKAPGSVKILVPFYALLLWLFIGMSQNMVLTIWLPVSILLVQVFMRLAKLKREGYEGGLRKITVCTYLLLIMWGIVFVRELVGGIL